MGIIGLILVIIGILIVILGSTFPLLRLYFADRSVISQLFWGGIIFLAGAVLLIYNAATMH